ADQVFRYTINETSTELIWVPIDARRRIKVKPMVNGTLVSVVQGLAALTILIGAIDLQYLSIVALGLIAIWIPSTFLLRRGYVSELLNSIEKRQLEFEDLTVDLSDSMLVTKISADLAADDES